MTTSSYYFCTANAEGEWIRISGKVVADDRPEVEEAVFNVMPRLREIYNQKSGNTIAPVYMVDAAAEFFDRTGKYEKIVF